MTDPQAAFPAFEKFVERHGLLANPKGILAARLPRILGQGQTRAEGLNMPPALIERQQELISLNLPDTAPPPAEVEREIEDARREVARHQDHMRNPDNRRRFDMQALHRLGETNKGIKDNQFFAGRLVLVGDKGGQNWSWSMTPHYPVISKIPADVDYIVAAHAAAEKIVDQGTLPVDQFLNTLQLAWVMARHLSPGDDVLIADVARLFKVAAQDERFWGTPARRNFTDVPDALFITNLINWRRSRDGAKRDSFELVPATLNQAHGTRSRAYFVPSNAEGTAVRPMIYLRRTADQDRRD
jgi:hypothetical protein